MGAFDLTESMQRAEARLGRSGRRPRSDKGHHRLDPAMAAALADVLGGHDRPSMQQVRAVLARRRGRRKTIPSRAAVYQFMSKVQLHSYRYASLPEDVREALYNLAGTTRVPGPQVVFYCFNHGNLAAMSFAAGLPWLDLYQAARIRGWRAKSRGLLEAVLAARGV